MNKNIKKSEKVTITEEFFLKLWEKIIKYGGVLLDKDLWGWFLGFKVVGISDDFTIAIKTLTKTLTLDQAVKEFDIPLSYSWFEAMKMITKSILSEKANKPGKCVIAVFKVKNKLYRISAYRHTDKELRVGINEFNLCKGIPLNTGDGICRKELK